MDTPYTTVNRQACEPKHHLTVITICRNALAGLKPMLESLLRQKAKGSGALEHVIVDGASADGTPECPAEQLAAGRIERYLTVPDRGINQYSHGKYGKALYRAQHPRSAGLIEQYPESKDELIHAMRHCLYCMSLQNHMPKLQEKFDKRLSLSNGFFTIPVTPKGIVQKHEPAIMDPFHKEGRHKATLHIGALNLVSFMKNWKQHKLYVLGRKIMQ